jgi:hypothetical protein
VWKICAWRERFIEKAGQLPRSQTLLKSASSAIFFPQAQHDVLVFLEAGEAEFAFAFDYGGAQGEAGEVALVQVAVIVGI